MIEDVNESLVDPVLLIFEDDNKTCGGSIEKHDYIKENRVLVIYYDNVAIAQRVLAHPGATYRAKQYKAKAVPNGLLENKHTPEGKLN